MFIPGACDRLYSKMLKRALPGCLIVLCSLGTDWMMGWGSFSSAVGSDGPPRAAMGPGPDGPGPPPWADLG